MSQPEPPPITLSFTLQGQTHHRIEVRPTRTKDPNEVCLEAVNSNTAVGYSGRHDHGDLVKLKTAGPLLELVSSIKDAKQACDAYLTEMIAREAAAASGAPEVKRPKLANDDEDGEAEAES